MGSYVFSGCDGLTSITIPDSVTSIDIYMCYGCDILEDATLGSGIKTMKQSYFESCRQLKTVKISSGVTNIGTSTFRNCNNLTSVFIPTSVKEINSMAFYGCTSLTNIYYEGTEEEWDLIKIWDDNTALSNATIHYNQKIATKADVIDKAAEIETYVNDTISKYDNFLKDDNNYIYLETLTSDGRENLILKNNGFDNYHSSVNETGRIVECGNDYKKSYNDFLIKIDMQISEYIPQKDAEGNLIGVMNAVGPFVFLFDGELAEKSIQFRCGANDFVTWIGEGGALTQVANLGIQNNNNENGTPKTFTFYFKLINEAGLLNIYQDSLDNLKASIALDKAQLANSTPKLAFGGRYCTYSATCEIHKAELELKPIKKADYELILNKDPYKYYMIEE
jgi:hypothetical protein